MSAARLYKTEYTASVLYLLKTIFVRLASVCTWTRSQRDVCNSKDVDFTKPMMCCVIIVTMTNSKLSLHLAKPAAFVRESQLILPLLTKEISRIILYAVNKTMKTLRELGLDHQRVSRSPDKQWNKIVASDMKHKNPFISDGCNTGQLQCGSL